MDISILFDLDSYRAADGSIHIIFSSSGRSKFASVLRNNGACGTEIQISNNNMNTTKITIALLAATLAIGGTAMAQKSAPAKAAPAKAAPAKTTMKAMPAKTAMAPKATTDAAKTSDAAAKTTAKKATKHHKKHKAAKKAAEGTSN